MTAISDTFSRAQVGPFLDGYFERTLEKTGGETDISFRKHQHDKSFTSYFLTSEPEYTKVLREIEGRGGTFVGVGQAVPITYAAWQESSRAYIVDRDASVPLGFTPLFGALLLMAPTRAEFLSLALARPIPASGGVWREADLGGDDLLRVFAEIPSNDALAAAIEETMISEIGARVPVALREGTREAVHKSLGELRCFDTIWGSPVSILIKKDAEGRGGPLADEASYQRHRRLFLENRVTGVVADMAGSAMQLFARQLEVDGDEVRVVYLSNIENWLFVEANTLGVYSVLHAFYANLLELPGAAEAVVAEAIDLFHSNVEALSSYVERAIPMALPPEKSGAVAFSFALMRIRLGDLGIRHQVPYLPAYLLEHGFGGRGIAIMRAANELLEGGSMPAMTFHRRMMKKSEAYRGLSSLERQLLLRNLERAGVLGRAAVFSSVDTEPAMEEISVDPDPIQAVQLELEFGPGTPSDPTAQAFSPATLSTLSSPLTSVPPKL